MFLILHRNDLLHLPRRFQAFHRCLTITLCFCSILWNLEISASCLFSDEDCYTAWTAVSTQLQFETQGKCSSILQTKVDQAYTLCQTPTCRDRTISLVRQQYLKGWWNPEPPLGLAKTIGNDYDHPSPQSLVQVALAPFNCSSSKSKTTMRIESYFQAPSCAGPLPAPNPAIFGVPDACAIRRLHRPACDHPRRAAGRGKYDLTSCTPISWTADP